MRSLERTKRHVTNLGYQSLVTFRPGKTTRFGTRADYDSGIVQVSLAPVGVKRKRLFRANFECVPWEARVHVWCASNWIQAHVGSDETSYTSLTAALWLPQGTLDYVKRQWLSRCSCTMDSSYTLLCSAADGSYSHRHCGWKPSFLPIHVK